VTPADRLAQYRAAIIARYYAHDDPVVRHDYARRLLDDHEALVALAADMRARAVAELHVDGWSYAKIADALDISRSAAQQLNERGRDVAIPPPA
jgi:DNA-directed RNA polymerase specialized sigma24 family protein